MMERCSSLGRAMRRDVEGIVGFSGGTAEAEVGTNILEGSDMRFREAFSVGKTTIIIEEASVEEMIE